MHKKSRDELAGTVMKIRSVSPILLINFTIDYRLQYLMPQNLRHRGVWQLGWCMSIWVCIYVSQSDHNSTLVHNFIYRV